MGDSVDTGSGRAAALGLLAEVDLTFSGAGNLYATHGLHAFAARCPPPLVDWAINSYSQPGGMVLDPMAGSGTTLVEASLLGRRGRAADIDPLARLISKAKATCVDLDGYDKATAEIDRLLNAAVLDDSWRPALPNWDYWFRDDVASDLARLREAIPVAATDTDIRDLLWVVFSSLIVGRTSVANARDLVHSRHHYREWTENPDAPKRFRRRAGQVRRMMHEYGEELRRRGVVDPDLAMVGGDARAVSVEADSVDLVFTSPPYCSALDYTRAHLFAVAWMPDVLGVSVEEYRTLGRSYVGSERAPLFEAGPGRAAPPPLGVGSVDRIVADLMPDPKRAWIVYRYFRDMAQVIAECARVTRSGGYVVFVVCPSNIRRMAIPTHRLLVDLANAAPSDRRLELVGCRERTIHDHRRVMPYLETAFGQRQARTCPLIFFKASLLIAGRNEVNILPRLSRAPRPRKVNPRNVKAVWSYEPRRLSSRQYTILVLSGCNSRPTSRIRSASAASTWRAWRSVTQWMTASST